MAELTVQSVDLSGLTPTFSACDSAGDTFKNKIGRAVLYFKNGDTADKTVTVTSLKECSQGYIHNVVVTVPTGGELVVGPFNVVRFNDTSQEVSITYDDVTSLTVAVLEFTY